MSAHDTGMPSRYPDFFVVGVVKGGTTALYNLLARHPSVHLGPIKETNHFSRGDMAPEHFSREYALDVRMDIGKYIANGMKEVVHIAHVNDPAQYLRLLSGARPDQLIGEVCPSYAICPSAAAAIHAVRPDAHIFIILRDPVRRVWSQYLMNLREGKTTESDLLKEVFSDDRRSPKGWGVNHQYLSLGLYADQVARYLALFPKDHVHILLHEDFKKDPDAVLGGMLNDLGLDRTLSNDTGERFNEASLPRSPMLNRLLVRSGVLRRAKDLVPRGLRGRLQALLYSKASMPELPLAQAEELWQYYAADVDRLSELMGRDLRKIWGNYRSKN